MRSNVQLERDARGRGRGTGGATGKGFKPGQSGNPGGWPKGLKRFNAWRVFCRAMDDDATEKGMIEALRAAAMKSRTVLDTTTLGARLSGELKPEATVPAVTIIVSSPVNPHRLRRTRA